MLACYFRSMQVDAFILAYMHKQWISVRIWVEPGSVQQILDNNFTHKRQLLTTSQSQVEELMLV
jgi:hypothetical protein